MAAAPGADMLLLVLLLLFMVIVLLALGHLCGVPATIADLRQQLSEWASFHEVVHRVDGRSWGLEKTFTLSMDLASTRPAIQSSCSWATVPGRRYEYGLVLWAAGVALSRLLTEQRASLAKSTFRAGCSVIEVGAGQALVSMVVHELFPGLKHVVVTDGDTDVLHSAGANILSNFGAEVASEAFVLALLRWGDAAHIARALQVNNGATYDVILGSDVTYTADGDHALVSTICDLAHESTEVWITHEIRDRPTTELDGLLRGAFRSVESFSTEVGAQEAGHSTSVSIVGWHCIGKVKLSDEAQ
eukprot:NODE_12170_length_1241_cov_6.834829.p1 GENE.NODE_12170_length_1241_cov_6.834829~~NODE_12170_length_1241_cov_6.834829.p1  ORF type:complete len:324 (+),score=89.94 NODE_12170_length_1241_cov_6.834829:67-972(+)